MRPQWNCAFSLNFPHSAESQASATEAKLSPNIFPCEGTGLCALCLWRSRSEKEKTCKGHHMACQVPVPKLVNQVSCASSLWWGKKKNGIVPAYMYLLRTRMDILPSLPSMDTRAVKPKEHPVWVYY